MNPSQPWMHNRLTIAGLIGGVLVFVQMYVFVVLSIVLRPGGDVAFSPFLPFLTMDYCAVNLLLADVTCYLVVSFVIAVLILVAMVREHHGPLMRGTLIVILLAILGLPLAYQYEAPVRPAPGVEVLFPTQPGLIDSVVKRAQEAAEITPCTYRILGWTGDNSLLYEETCGGDAPLVLSYTPATAGAPVAVDRELASIPLTDASKEVSGLLRSRSGDGPPPSVTLSELGVRTADGRWAAVVVRHPYGPEDVAVIRIK